MVEGQQRGVQIEQPHVVVLVVLEVQDPIVLAVTVAVEVAVRVVEEDAARVLLDEFFLAGGAHGLPEGRRVLEGESVLTQPVAAVHPLLTAGAPVSLVDEHEVVAFEGVDGDRLLALLLTQLVDVDDLDRMTREQASPCGVEELRLDA